jgi:hypothetical protein
MSKHGIVTSMGWTGPQNKQKFRAIVEFPNGPPHLPVAMVWEHWPVNIVRTDDDPLSPSAPRERLGALDPATQADPSSPDGEHPNNRSGL